MKEWKTGHTYVTPGAVLVIEEELWTGSRDRSRIENDGVLRTEPV